MPDFYVRVINTSERTHLVKDVANEEEAIERYSDGQVVHSEASAPFVVGVDRLEATEQ